MATLSEANYSLVLDYPVQDESVIPEEPEIAEQEVSDDSDGLILYQKYHSAKDEEDVLNQAQVEQIGEINSSQRSIEEFEVNMYSFSFQFGMFFRSLLISLLYAIGIGVPLLIPLACCGSNFIHNYHWHSDGYALLTFGAVSTTYLVHGWMTNTLMDMTFESIYHYQAMLIYSFAASSIQAYCNKKFLDVLSRFRLSMENFSTSRFRIDSLWKTIYDEGLNSGSKIHPTITKMEEEGASKEEIQREIKKIRKEEEKLEILRMVQTTISRLNIDISLFYLTFFEETPNNLLRELSKTEDLAIVKTQDKLFVNKIAQKSYLLLVISGFERRIFHYKYLTKPNKYDSQKAHAYTLAVDLLVNIQQKTYAAFILLGCLYLSLIVCSYIFTVASIVQNDPYMNNWVTGVKFFFWLSYANYPTFFLGYITFQAIKIMSDKYTYMEELKELISMERQRLDNGKEKSYPTLNTLDFMSLKAWTCLRKIFMHVNDEKLQGQILAITITMIIEFLTLVIVALHYFKILGPPGTDYSNYMIFYGLQAILYLSTFLILAYFAAKVNAQFKVHRNLIRANKQIAISLFRMYPDFVGENPIEPGTYIYIEGLKFLKKEFGEDFSHATKKKMKEKLQILIETYDSVLEELDNEEDQNPIKILGLPITSTVVKSFATVLVSISAPMIKQGLTYLYTFLTVKFAHG